MQRMISILIGALLACTLAAAAQGQTTATVSGSLNCVSNGTDNNYPSPNDCVAGIWVDPESGIGTGSYFTLEFTLPNTDQPPTDTTPPIFPSQTAYLVSPLSGEFGLTATIDGIPFPSNVDTLPFPGSGNLRVTVTNDETFGVFFPPGIDQWSVSSFGNTDVIPVPAGAYAVACSLEINGPSTQIVSNSYFVPLSLAGWFFPGGTFIRCDVIAPNPDFDDTEPQSATNFPLVLQQVLTGLVSDYDTITRVPNDADDDGVLDPDDNCPAVANSNQNDLDEDGEGDACDNDIDGDEVFNDYDNCEFDPNTNQTDTDGDGAGDVCDDDIDGDGVLDAVDSCVPSPLGAVVDADGCAISELCPCEHPSGEDKWKNHGAYNACVADASEGFVAAGLISEEEKDAIMSEAGMSSCGHKIE